MIATEVKYYLNPMLGYNGSDLISIGTGRKSRNFYSSVLTSTKQPKEDFLCSLMYHSRPLLLLKES